MFYVAFDLIFFRICLSCKCVIKHSLWNNKLHLSRCRPPSSLVCGQLLTTGNNGCRLAHGHLSVVSRPRFLQQLELQGPRGPRLELRGPRGPAACRASFSVQAMTNCAVITRKCADLKINLFCTVLNALNIFRNLLKTNPSLIIRPIFVCNCNT